MSEETRVRSVERRLLAIFVKPRATFKEIDLQPTWVLPLLLTGLLSLAVTILSVERIGLEKIFDIQIRSSTPSPELSAENTYSSVDSNDEKQLRYFVHFVYLWSFVGALLAPLCSAAILLVFLLMAGATAGFASLKPLPSPLEGDKLFLLMAAVEAGFPRVFSVTCHTFFLYSVIMSIPLVVLVMVSTDPGALDLENPFPSNLGFLADRGESPALHALASSVDAFSLYHLYLLSLGMVIVRRGISASRAAAVPIAAWVFYVGARVVVIAMLTS